MGHNVGNSIKVDCGKKWEAQMSKMDKNEGLIYKYRKYVGSMSWLEFFLNIEFCLISIW